MKKFYIDFNDPIYIKMEKLDIIYRLADEKNVDFILLELKKYTNEVDVEFVRKSLRVVGKLAIKLEKSANVCVGTLKECIKTKKPYVVQESIVVMREVFRKYPKKFSAVLKDLFKDMKVYDEPEAKAAMVWIIGEYAEIFTNTEQILTKFIESFPDEPAMVQLQILSSGVKHFLRNMKDSNTHAML